MSFEEQIQNWVAIDNKIKRANNELKTLRLDRNDLSKKITMYVESNNLNSAVVNISDGSLKFQDIKVTSPLTLKFIETCLNECIESEENVKNIMEYIKSKRNVKYVHDIKRYYNK
tara:strand:+ start:1271 stop:1615 length:345 start_codon:yes stop_codon:yes gene_type:complete